MTTGHEHDGLTEPERVEFQLEFEGPEVERLVTVAGDLEYLRSLPTRRLLSHAEVRLTAGTLRRLLIDGQLSSLMRCAVGARPQLLVSAVDIDIPLNTWPDRWVRYAFAGGAPVSGAHHTGVVFGVVPKEEIDKAGSPDALLEQNPLAQHGTPRIAAIEQYLASTAVAIQTNEIGLVRISRREVLQYIANRKGGVHFDPRRDLAIADRKKWRKEAVYHLLDHGLLRVGHLSGPEYEIQSMAATIADADWAGQIISTAQTAAPADFGGDPNELRFWTGLREADGTGWATSTFSPQPPAIASETDGHAGDGLPT